MLHLQLCTANGSLARIEEAVFKFERKKQERGEDGVAAIRRNIGRRYLALLWLMFHSLFD